ncbi:MAG: hypothetical protein BWY99_02342 [Synergistetes bacterium ADurb.BinA166]|nr:MAG: hypothetical protein BWY99_02342 [Synergistetes bacterium ADurb.BinA166]
MSSDAIPCRCENGRPCGKVLRVREIGRLTMLDIVGCDDSKGLMLDADGRRQLIEALGGRA